ncbi:MAG: OmpA family protein [Clostridiaceae bacterium]
MNDRPKKEKAPEVGAPLWMASYGDLVTNLLCLFVLLFSFAILDLEKFEKIAYSMRSAFSGSSSLLDEHNGDTMISITPFDNMATETNEGEDSKEGTEGDNTGEGLSEAEKAELKKAQLGKAKVNIEKLIQDMGLSENIKVIEEGSIIIFRVDSIILFDTGKADLKDDAKPVITKIASALKELKTDIMVQGHADDRPINTAAFPSNWELSTKRATNVVKYMTETSGIEPKYLTATGNAEFKPIVPNDSEYNRQKNRRIDIIIAQ